VGELGTVLVTGDGGETWEIQPNITAKLLQAIAYRGDRKIWVGGRGGAIIKRIEPLSPSGVKTPSMPPILGIGRSRPKARTPLITITDDGDIPAAVKPEKPD
jgi:hypothetical protein